MSVDKLDVSDQSDVSSVGTDSALGNGDLIINGLTISSSSAPATAATATIDLAAFTAAASGSDIEQTITLDGSKLTLTKTDGTAAYADDTAQCADLGAIQNRFETTVKNLQVNAENLTASNSRIRDTDFASEGRYFHFGPGQCLASTGVVTALVKTGNRRGESQLLVPGLFSSRKKLRNRL